MLIDQIYILCYLAIILVLVRVVRGTWRTEENDDVLDSKKDIRLLVWLSLIFIAALGAVIGLSLR